MSIVKQSDAGFIATPVCLCSEITLTHIINEKCFCSKCGCLTQEEFNRRFKR